MASHHGSPSSVNLTHKYYLLVMSTGTVVWSLTAYIPLALSEVLSSLVQRFDRALRDRSLVPYVRYIPLALSEVLSSLVQRFVMST